MNRSMKGFSMYRQAAGPALALAPTLTLAPSLPTALPTGTALALTLALTLQKETAHPQSSRPSRPDAMRHHPTGRPFARPPCHC